MKNSAIVPVLNAERSPNHFPRHILEWLRLKAIEVQGSIETAMAVAMDPSIEADPLRVFVRQIPAPGDPAYEVSLGVSGARACFFNTCDLDNATAAALAKVKELGLSKSAIVHEPA